MSINRFLATVARQGGMSFSNNFTVKLVNPPVGVSAEFNEFVEFMCDEAQLPNSNTADGNMVGVHQGLGSVRYPHTRVFTEVQLSFMLDANLEMLKYFQGWQDYIFDARQIPLEAKNNWSTIDGQPLKRNRVIRLNYMDDYVCDVEITKTESGPTSTTQRKPITYVLERAYPYAIDAVPLQFGSSQITKVTVQLAYERHYTIMRDIKSIKDAYIPAGGVLVGEVEIGPGRFKQEWLLPNGRILTTEGSKRATGTAPSAPPKTVPANPTPPPGSGTTSTDPRARARARGT